MAIKGTRQAQNNNPHATGPQYPKGLEGLLGSMQVDDEFIPPQREMAYEIPKGGGAPQRVVRSPEGSSSIKTDPDTGMVTENVIGRPVPRFNRLPQRAVWFSQNTLPDPTLVFNKYGHPVHVSRIQTHPHEFQVPVGPGRVNLDTGAGPSVAESAANYPKNAERLKALTGKSGGALSDEDAQDISRMWLKNATTKKTGVVAEALSTGSKMLKGDKISRNYADMVAEDVVMPSAAELPGMEALKGVEYLADPTSPYYDLGAAAAHAAEMGRKLLTEVQADAAAADLMAHGERRPSEDLGIGVPGVPRGTSRKVGATKTLGTKESQIDAGYKAAKAAASRKAAADRLAAGIGFDDEKEAAERGREEAARKARVAENSASTRAAVEAVSQMVTASELEGMGTIKPNPRADVPGLGGGRVIKSNTSHRPAPPAPKKGGGRKKKSS